MSAAVASFVPRGWLRLPIRSARLRLTVLYSGMFLALGTAVIVVIYLVGSSATAIRVSAVPTPAGVRPVPSIHVALSQQHSADVDRLLAGAWATLALTAAASALLGWFLAGRVLAPLREMTVAARTISAGNLHRRIALGGPEDEFKQLGDTIDDLLARLEASFAAQRRFVANAAHELRTPLTLERTILQVALTDPTADAASLKATCEELLVSGRDQEHLLDSLLTLATSERGLESREPLDLSAVVSAVVATFRPEADQTFVEVSSRLEPARISGDRALIECLVANLVENGIRYNHRGGCVEIQTWTAADGVALLVSNTGRQIPAEDLDRLFEPFQRLENDRTGGDGHHGLGLSIVRAVATAHGATVTAIANPEGGLRITVRFRPARDSGS